MHFPKSIRLPAEAYANPGARFHLTIAAHPELRELSSPIRDVLWHSLLEQRTGGRVQVLAACLMPDHLHLLVGPTDRGVIAFIQQWKSWSTRLAWAAGHRGPLWQPGVWDRAIRGSQDFEAVCSYILGNPVKAGLADEPEHWPWNCAYWIRAAILKPA